MVVSGEPPFVKACSEGDLKWVKRIFKASFPLPSKDPFLLQKGLLAAIQHSQLEVVSYLIQKRKFPLNDPPPPSQLSPFWVCCQEDRLSSVQLFLSCPRVSVNQVDLQDQNVFGWACEHGKLNLVKLLLKSKKISFNQKRKDGSSPFLLACKESHLQIIRLLLDSPDIDINQARNDGMNGLLVSCQNGDLPLCRLLLDHKKIDPFHVATNGSCAFFLACQSGNGELVRYLAGLDRIVTRQLNQADLDGRSPLYVACERGNQEVVKILLQHPLGVDLNQPKKTGVTPLYAIAFNNHVALLPLLLSDKRLNITSPSPLFVACKRGNWEIGRRLGMERRMDLNGVMESGATPFAAAVNLSLLEVIRFLFSLSAKIQTFCQTESPRANEARWPKEILRLVKKYRKDPVVVSHRLRHEIGLHDAFAAEVFSLMIFFSDDFLSFPPL